MQRSLTAANSPFPDPVVSLGNDITDRNTVYSSACQRAPPGLHVRSREVETAGSLVDSPFPDPVVSLGNDITDQNTVYSSACQRAPPGLHVSSREVETAGTQSTRAPASQHRRERL